MHHVERFASSSPENQIENIIAVSTKSSASTAREETTTVRVVACETPSGVGLQAQPCSRATKVTAIPNTTLLMTPLPTSAKTSTLPCICDQKAPASMPISGTATSQPPMMPTAEKTAASKGIAMKPPQKRGASTRCTGSTAIISI